ncbi:hypothetical protein AKJ09_00403 [Labilithrix luteola]|uniref:STAS domain-containing protein n=1 Tax=Labilithrix luteola TaxID=1391654 RepID=A0A0K1PKW6_9BACT|nr:hypothetical protein [Labilithrix luteola]AKU93739.1 hypothetical protein AKJ09_00403 [Labilithrix luteola]
MKPKECSRPATLRVRDTIVFSFRCTHVDRAAGVRMVELVVRAMHEGARVVVFDLGYVATIALEGAHQLSIASTKLGGEGRLRLVGLGERARLQLGTLAVYGELRLHSHWADAVDVNRERAA